MASQFEGFRFQTIAELRGLLQGRHASALEVATSVLENLDRLGRPYNAIAELTPERALDSARRADRRLRAGDRAPLLGIPYAIKDVIAAKGVPTRWGSPTHADQVAVADACVVERLTAAGMVLVATTSTIELAGAGGYRSTAASINGTTLNPWNREHWAGGSSSGPAAVVSAGLVPIALGTDTGGSIMVPSAFCGIVGLRPTHGTVSSEGVMPLAPTMDKVGPMTRSVDDAALILDALRNRVENNRASGVNRDSRSALRVGLLPAEWDEADESRTVFASACSTLASVGFEVVACEVPRFDYESLHRTIMAGEWVAHHRAFIESGRVFELLDPAQSSSLRAFASQPKHEYLNALRTRREVMRSVRRLFADVDLLVGPTSTCEALRVEDDVSEFRAAWPYIPLGSVVGLPALTIPIGFGPNGLPLGMSLIGDWLTEPLLFRVGTQFQVETQWHTCRPC